MLSMQSVVLATGTVELSVRLSDIRWNCVKTTQARVTKSSPKGSPRALFLAVKSLARNSKGITQSEGVK